MGKAAPLTGLGPPRSDLAGGDKFGVYVVCGVSLTP